MYNIRSKYWVIFSSFNQLFSILNKFYCIQNWNLSYWNEFWNGQIRSQEYNTVERRLIKCTVLGCVCAVPFEKVIWIGIKRPFEKRMFLLSPKIKPVLQINLMYIWMSEFIKINIPKSRILGNGKTPKTPVIFFLFNSRQVITTSQPNQ